MNKNNKRTVEQRKLSDVSQKSMEYPEDSLRKGSGLISIVSQNQTIDTRDGMSYKD